MTQGTALGVVGTLHGMLGEFDVARSYLGKGEAILRDLGAVLFLAAAHPPALVENLAGKPEAAEALMRAGIETFQAVGETGFLSTCAVILGEALYAQGRLDEALEASQLGESHTASGDVSSEMGWRSVQAKVLARLGQVEEAERLAREAVAIAERTDSPNDRGQCFMALAEVLRAAGKPGEALSAAQRALDSYEQKGNVVSTREARAFIEEIGS
jgi:tetratricopeptide (TPR) repeat protein